MNIRKLFFRSEQRTEVEEVELWYVRWTARYGAFSSDTREVTRAFPDKEEAKQFKSALEDAFKLVQNTSENTVYLSKN